MAKLDSPWLSPHHVLQLWSGAQGRLAEGKETAQWSQGAPGAASGMTPAVLPTASSAPDSPCSVGPSGRKVALAGIRGFLGTEDAESHQHLTIPPVKLPGPLTFMAVSLKVHVNGP